MNRGVALFWIVIVAGSIVRVYISQYERVPSIGDCVKNQVSGYGIIVEEPIRTNTNQVLVVETEELVSSSSSCAKNIRLRMKTKLYPEFSYADHVHFVGKINSPVNFSSNNGRSFDYRGYLAKDEIFYEMKGASVHVAPHDISSTCSQHLFSCVMMKITDMLYRLKLHFVDNLNLTLGEPHAALAAGLVVGEKSALGKDLLNDFRTVGLIHIVVLSGFNITIVADALRRVLSFLPRAWGLIIGAIGMLAFGVLVGGGATVVRSCVMASVALWAQFIRRDYHVLRTLIFAGCIMVIQQPSILFHDPSFQLSFLATLGLILLSTPVEHFLSFLPAQYGLRGIVAATVATQIFVSPFILYMMGQISIVGVIVNILVLPFVPLTMCAVFFTGASGFISYVVSQIAGWSAHLLLGYELFMVHFFSRVPYAAIQIPPFSVWWVVGFYAVCILIYFSRPIFLRFQNFLQSLSN